MANAAPKLAPRRTVEALRSGDASYRLQGAMARGILGLPRPTLRLLGGPPVRVDGQELDVEAQVLLRLQRLSGATRLSAATPDKARQAMRRSQHFGGGPLPGVRVAEHHIPASGGEIGARLYRPKSASDGDRAASDGDRAASDGDRAGEPSPLLVFYHGGGFVLGDLDTHDSVARFLARYAGVRVLAVDYRLAPEHPFPAAVDDALAAFRYATEHAAELGTAPERIAVGGDSAGGNLAAVVAHRGTRDSARAPVFQLLLYPVVDATTRRRSRELFGEGFLLTDGDMDWFMDHYVPAVDDRADPRVSVLLADDLCGLPPAYVATAGFDPLRDEGEAYATRLSESGVPVAARRFTGQIHGFANLAELGGGFRDALFEIAGALRTGLAMTTIRQPSSPAERTDP